MQKPITIWLKSHTIWLQKHQFSKHCADSPYKGCMTPASCAQISLGETTVEVLRIAEFRSQIVLKSKNRSIGQRVTLLFPLHSQGGLWPWTVWTRKAGTHSNCHLIGAAIQPPTFFLPSPGHIRTLTDRQSTTPMSITKAIWRGRISVSKEQGSACQPPLTRQMAQVKRDSPFFITLTKSPQN
jgi:hypothetical protein